MLWEVHWLGYNTMMHNKYCTIHNIDTVAYAMHGDYFIIIIIVAHQGHKG